jgi:acetyl-CoA carboxylase carboxyl transferase subunit alpha
MSLALDFEKVLAELHKQLEQAEKHLTSHPSDEAQRERDRLASELQVKTAELYQSLTAWQKVQVARHASRPQTLDYAKAIFTDFIEFHGDRLYADDHAIVGGPARLDGMVVMLVGHQRGKGTKEAVERNFGQPHPEGYRKALRLFRHAERFGMPVVTFLDTPAASPGLEDEERGQAWALAQNIGSMADLRVPIVSAIIGQGGSGGALAIGVADRLLMMEHSIFSVAPPETAANILWKDPKLASEAAAALKITAKDLHALGLVDRVVPEPPGAAHGDPAAAAELLGEALKQEVHSIVRIPIGQLVEQRYERYRRVGAFTE